MSYRRYQRSLAYRKYYDDNDAKTQIPALPKESNTKTVSFNKDVTEIPKSETPDLPADATIPKANSDTATLSTEALTVAGNRKRQTPEPTDIAQKTQASIKARAEANQLRISTPLTRTTPTNDPNKGKYTNWSTHHAILAEQPWCSVSDLIAFCDKYEFTSISLHDTKTHNTIVAEVTALLKTDTAPFDIRRRFPGNIHDPENLWVCIGRCAGVEYHLKRILSVFRKPLDKLTPDKQRTARQNFHLAVNELRLDISARISEVRLYDRNIFESDFNLKWQNDAGD